jgi:hypothetical protein
MGSTLVGETVNLERRHSGEQALDSFAFVDDWYHNTPGMLAAKP